MSLPITSIVRNSDGTWTFAWTATLATYYRVVLFGQQLAVVTSPTYTTVGISIGQSYPKFPPPVEVVEQVLLALSETYQPSIYVQWYGTPGVSYYELQAFVGGVWTKIQRFSESGQWIYTWQSPVLSDETTYQYRVVAVDSLGNQSTPRLYTINMVRLPDSPDKTTAITYTGSGTHQVQVSPA